MSKKTPADLLRDVLHELADIADFTREGREAFLTDSKTRKAVIRSYEIVGEIAKRLPESLRDEHSSVNWNQLIRFRDFLAHHYEEVLIEYVWQAVEDVPLLQASLRQVLADITAPPDE